MPQEISVSMLSSQNLKKKLDEIMADKKRGKREEMGQKRGKLAKMDVSCCSLGT